MKMIQLNVTMLIVLTLAFCPPMPASSQDESCTDRCEIRKDNCSRRAKQRHDQCLSRADRWREREEQAAEKDKDPDRTIERVEQQYRMKRKACQENQTKMEAGCTKARTRCLKACDLRFKRKSR